MSKPHIKRTVVNPYESVEVWESIQTPESFSIVPSPRRVVFQFLRWLMVVAGFVWVFTVVGATLLESPKTDHWLFRVIAAVILLGIPLVGFCYWRKTRADRRPYLIVSKVNDTVTLPRAGIELQRDDPGYVLSIDRHVIDIDTEGLDLTLVLFNDGNERNIPILQFSGPSAEFDQIGMELELCDVPFRRREFT